MSKRELKQEEIRQLLKRRGPLSSTEISRTLGLTQPTFSRLVPTISDLLIIGAGRSRLYGLRRSSESYPIVRVSEQGDVLALGEIRLLEPKGAVFLPSQKSNLAPAVYNDIPYFIWDLRPQGYLGKIFVNQYPELRLPDRWEDWREEDLFRTLKVRGDDLVGNLIIGRESFERFQSKEMKVLSVSQRAKEYPRIALETLEGFHVGSSAGGEQPKFTVAIDGAKDIRHVIVKFSPPVETEAGRRWADLLVAESLALSLLRESGYSAADAEVLEGKERVFLEVNRFDRISRKGRRGVLSLGAIDDEYVGSRNHWTTTALRLQEQGLIGKRDAETIVFLDCFGAHIANSDRHFGNLSLYWELGAKKFALAPVYDMLPMAYAPAQGNLVHREFRNPVAQFEQIDVWKTARSLAVEFWRSLSEDRRVSLSFREIARSNAKVISEKDAP